MTEPDTSRVDAPVDRGAQREPWFESAARATRERFDGQSPCAFQTELALLGGASKKRRILWSFWWLPTAAALLVSVASAHQVRSGVSWIAERVSVWVSPTPTQTAVEEHVRINREPDRATHAPAQLPSAVATSEQTVPSVPARLETREVEPRSVRREPGPQSSELQPSASQRELEPPAPKSAPSDLQLYRAAHEAHFVRGDFAAALLAWDRYLQFAHKGQFVPEARFNRALALVRLGRKQLAIEALEPFAQGAYGNYRSEEARRLLRDLR
jgi:hypothetical protein